MRSIRSWYLQNHGFLHDSPWRYFYDRGICSIMVFARQSMVLEIYPLTTQKSIEGDRGRIPIPPLDRLLRCQSSVCLRRPLSIGIVVQVFPNCFPVHTAFHSCVFVSRICGSIELRFLKTGRKTGSLSKDHDLANTAIVKIPLVPWAVMQKPWYCKYHDRMEHIKLHFSCMIDLWCRQYSIT